MTDTDDEGAVSGREAVAAGTHNVDAATETRHTGWDRGDYDVEELGDDGEIPEPKGADSWREERDKTIRELNALSERLSEARARSKYTGADGEVESLENRQEHLRLRLEAISCWLRDEGAL